MTAIRDAWLSPGMIDGFRIVADLTMSDRVQYRFPRSRKKRMRKKWAKDIRNYRNVPWDRVYRIGDVLYAHPAVIQQLKATLGRAAAG